MRTVWAINNALLCGQALHPGPALTFLIHNREKKNKQINVYLAVILN